MTRDKRHGVATGGWRLALNEWQLLFLFSLSPLLLTNVEMLYKVLLFFLELMKDPSSIFSLPTL